MTVFPQTNAMGSVHIGTMNGKLNGTMDATTPRGSRRSWHVTCDETRRFFPWANWGSEAAYSTVSFPFATSARAINCQLTNLKCGRVSKWAFFNSCATIKFVSYNERTLCYIFAILLHYQFSQLLSILPNQIMKFQHYCCPRLHSQCRPSLKGFLRDINGCINVNFGGDCHGRNLRRCTRRFNRHVWQCGGMHSLAIDVIVDLGHLWRCFWDWINLSFSLFSFWWHFFYRLKLHDVINWELSLEKLNFMGKAINQNREREESNDDTSDSRSYTYSWFFFDWHHSCSETNLFDGRTYGPYVQARYTLRVPSRHLYLIFRKDWKKSRLDMNK